MTKEYCVLEGHTLVDLEIKVSEFINSGWEPLGGVAVKAEDESNLVKYYQAMIKETP